jgi:hypothetical protein
VLHAISLAISTPALGKYVTKMEFIVIYIQRELSSLGLLNRRRVRTTALFYDRFIVRSFRLYHFTCAECFSASIRPMMDEYTLRLHKLAFDAVG